MMEAYDSLSVFPDVQPALEKIKDIKDLRVVIHSNGTYEMVSSSVKNSLSPFVGLFQDIIGTDQCRRYKPAAEAYQHLAQKLGKDALDAKEMEKIWHVSSNPFDVAGARAVGLNSIWVDRKGTGWQDSLILSERGRPTKTVESLDAVVEIIKKAVDGESVSR